MHLGKNSTHLNKSLKKEKIVKRAGACAIEFWAKRTRACDVRAAENRVCECACVRSKNSSQLTACKYYVICFCLLFTEKMDFLLVEYCSSGEDVWVNTVIMLRN